MLSVSLLRTACHARNLSHRFSGTRFLSRQLSGFSYPAPRKLDALVKLDLLSNETPEKVKEIWLGYHAEKEFNIAEVWSAGEFRAFQDSVSSTGNYFILPVPREGGHFVILSQVQEKHVIFTYLEDFKKDPQGAQPYLVVTFYDELASGETSNPVLVRGDIIPLTLDREESFRLLRLVKKCYLEHPAEVASFNKGDFDFEAHIARILKE